MPGSSQAKKIYPAQKNSAPLQDLTGRHLKSAVHTITAQTAAQSCSLQMDSSKVV
jgi:hypothetical protein